MSLLSYMSMDFLKNKNKKSCPFLATRSSTIVSNNVKPYLEFNILNSKKKNLMKITNIQSIFKFKKNIKLFVLNFIDYF